MKRFQFTLRSMLHYKDALLEKEKNALLQIRARLATIEEKIERNGRQLVDLEQEHQQKAERGITALELMSYRFQLENTRSLLRQYRTEQASIEVEEERQRKTVLALSQEVSGLEKLREKQLDAYQYASQKEEELRIGELVSSKYVTAQASSFE